LIDSVSRKPANSRQEVLLPLNASGDAEGCHYENGVVRTPKGFKEAYRAFVEGGWGALSLRPEYGGQACRKASPSWSRK
jgi:alkylation response protein AidB-like acyl-CoA dehydrogenase